MLALGRAKRTWKESFCKSLATVHGSEFFSGNSTRARNVCKGTSWNKTLHYVQLNFYGNLSEVFPFRRDVCFPHGIHFFAWKCFDNVLRKLWAHYIKRMWKKMVINLCTLFAFPKRNFSKEYEPSRNEKYISNSALHVKVEHGMKNWTFCLFTWLHYGDYNFYSLPVAFPTNVVGKLAFSFIKLNYVHEYYYFPFTGLSLTFSSW